MGGDEGNKHLMFFPGLMQMQGSTAYSLPGFPPQIHLPLPPGAYPPPPPGAFTYAGPGYAYAQAHAYAYPPPPPPPPPPPLLRPPPPPAAGPYAFPPEGYPHPGSSAPHQGRPSMHAGHGSSGRQIEVMESAPPKSGGTAAAATASATAAYGAISNLFRGQQGSTTSRNNEAFGRRRCFGNCCGGQYSHGTASFKQLAGHGHQGKFKRGHGPGNKTEHVRGKFSAKRTTWKY